MAQEIDLEHIRERTEEIETAKEEKRRKREEAQELKLKLKQAAAREKLIAPILLALTILISAVIMIVTN